MTLEHCHKIILLYRLRGRARDMMQAQQKAGNRAAADIYARIDAWLETLMANATARRNSAG